MPGDFTTRSNAANRSAVASVSTDSNASPRARASLASSALQNSVSASCGNFERIARYAARPSRPQPQSATLRSLSERITSGALSGSELSTQAFPQLRGDAVLDGAPISRFLDGQQ